MKTISEFINSVITEASLDERIENGIVDLKNMEHLKVVAETLYDKGADEELVNEIVETFMEEGKYPDRQAFNKEGWLVTFPSKEYRDAAVKKGTHAISDPTHGKGGMNLYYKRKGKQKRQTQQAVSKTEKPEQAPSNAPAKKPAVAQPQGQKRAPGELTPDMMGDDDTSTPTPPKPPGAEKPVAPEKPTEPAEKPAPAPQKPSAAEPQTSEPAPTPAVDVPVVTTPPAQYAEISEKFAKQKGWTKTEYGEYRDGEGNPVAVVGLSGEAVPIRTNDREEYKIFAEKQMP